MSSLSLGERARRPVHVLVPAAVLTAALIFPLTITGASLALPGIIADFDADAAGTAWVVTGYNAVFAAFLALCGTLADVLGRRRIFLVGTTVFSAAGLVAARARAFAGLGMVLGTGLAFGPTVSGMLVSAGGWRATFAVPAVAAAVAGLLALAIPGLRPPSRTSRIDWAGGLLFTAALLGLVVTLNEAPGRGWTHPFSLATVTTTVLLTAAFVVVERCTTSAMFDLKVLRNRRFTACAVTAGVFMAVLVPLVIYLPTYLIEVTGRGTAAAGTIMLLLTVPALVFPPLGARLARRVPIRFFLPAALVCTAAGAALLPVAFQEPHVWMLAIPFILIGTGPGLTNGVVDGMAVGALPDDQAGTAAGLFNTARLATEAVSLTIVAATLASATGEQLGGAGLDDGIRVVAIGLAITALVAALTVTTLLRPTTRVR
ncbi:MFS transporter [Phytoactinopolyspora limicola]|uniref:MFS transporter n=1 Tax=Phytoactinopolyspora limicola TaxID=2715536 RepID=UPI001407D3A5|nr:MFS transporter [Phytoactinopolyspora limicola]